MYLLQGLTYIKSPLPQRAPTKNTQLRAPHQKSIIGRAQITFSPMIFLGSPPSSGGRWWWWGAPGLVVVVGGPGPWPPWPPLEPGLNVMCYLLSKQLLFFLFCSQILKMKMHNRKNSSFQNCDVSKILLFYKLLFSF